MRLEEDPATAARWLPDACFCTRFGVFVVRHGGRTILIDCGLGPGPIAYFPGLVGGLPLQLGTIGLTTEAVDLVVFTHLHLDHVGWAVDGDGRPRFANARYIVGAEEWAHWDGLGERAGLPHHVAGVRNSVAPLARAGRLDCVEAGARIAAGVTLIDSAGHSPGHRSVLVEAGDRRVLITGDLWHNPAQIARPGWCHRADMNKAAAIAARRRIRDAALDNGWLIASGHFLEEDVFGRIERVAGEARFVPLPG
ncbi:MAG: MBL fold metallo-hydrolase [Proteobacteria bacterium]|nr:MBL fold metallo-hydrolase [Pseudomonadota bacterium]MBI3496271.1 MBL fold metallo-hydrolase [Pseudomonadota bacterium]